MRKVAQSATAAPSATTATPTTGQLTAEAVVKQCAAELGFDIVGIADAAPFDRDRDITLQRLSEGLMDGLPWFTAARVRRGANPQAMLPNARSIISVGMSYHPPPSADAAAANDDGAVGRIARYAWGKDYHAVMKRRLRRLANTLAERLNVDITARWHVDDGPMLDRAAANRAGVGWFGKNTNILSPSHGSWIFLGQLVTNLALTPDAPLKKSCGSCTICIDKCPTGALVDAGKLDNRLCISHLTIENRGAIPKPLRPLMFDWVFGCDICQDVCPVNVKAMYTKEQAFRRKRFSAVRLVELLTMTQGEFDERYAGMAIRRAKLEGMQRNACVALGNSGDATAVPALVTALNGGTTLVRRHAAWALGRIGGDTARAALKAAMIAERDGVVRAEIADAIEDAAHA